MNRIAIFLLPPFVWYAATQNIAFSILIAALIYMTYAYMLLRNRKVSIPDDINNVADGFLSEYSKSHNSTRSLGKSAGSSIPLKSKLSELHCQAKLGASNFPRDLVSGIGIETRHFLDIVCEGIRSGADVLYELEIFLARVKERSKQNSIEVERTEGMHTLSQLGIAFFFPMFAGISSSIMHTVIGQQFVGNLGSAFAISIISYIGLIIFISTSFKRTESSVVARFDSLVPLFVTGTLVFLLSSYLPNIF